MSSCGKGALSATAKAEGLSPEIYIVARGQAFHFAEASMGDWKVNLSNIIFAADVYSGNPHSLNNALYAEYEERYGNIHTIHGSANLLFGDFHVEGNVFQKIYRSDRIFIVTRDEGYKVKSMFHHNSYIH